MDENADLSALLATQPGWDAMNAYARTKLVCAELLRAGAPIPAWTTIRGLIGKGSANDINRAKKDFRLEHAQSLRKLEGFSAEGVPQTLTPHILGLWQAAIAHAQGVFSEKERVWEAEVEDAVAAHQQAQTELVHAQAAMQALQIHADGLEQARLALQERIHSEQAARAQAEKMMNDIRADLIDQRDRLDKALAHAQTELNKAIHRLEAAERRAMMEIERTQQEAAQTVAHATMQIKTEQEKHVQETTRLAGQIQAGQSRAARLQEQNIVLEQENRTLAERTKRAEALVDALRAQHATLHARHAALLTSFAQPGQQRRHAALKKKRLRRQAHP